ncbi:MAG TPA: SPOR domain-containing protein [Gammaproteobacteria bacterium]|nr:SPOR domain-containing protein [Gammaproteobacteria bacterium]
MSKESYPGWAYLLAGLTIGLFVAFLVYLNGLPEPERAVARQADGKRAEKAPQFDFYKILPELEVVVPGLEVKGKQQTRQQPKPPEPTVELATGEQFILQAGSFRQYEQADKLKASLALLGIEADIQKVTVDSDTWHRVRIGPFTDRNHLNAMRKRLEDNDITAITLKVSG